MSVTSGTTLGPYKITSQLGAGGMGEVYAATDTRLDRTVAIKVLPEHLASDPSRRERFEREAKAVSSLNHPHICTLYDVGEQDGTHYLVMELVEGETLESRLAKGRLPLDQALEYAIQIADALDKAHRQGVVHRDLKPGNIMLTKSGVKLLDFGLAKLKGDASPTSGLSQAPTQDRSLTAEGTILGTLQYMAPEQLEGEEADSRTDIFAFGAVVYEMVTGKKAFEGKSQASLIGAIMNSEPQPMGELEAMTPRTLDRVVRTCLAKDPDDRWQSARDLMREVGWVNAERSGESVTAVEAIRSPSRVSRFALPLVTLIAIVFAVYFVSVRAPSDAWSLEVTTPPTNDPYSLAISPDGQYLVVVANSQQGPQLWLRDLESGGIQPLEGTRFATLPFWSPDSRSVGFFADARLKTVSIETAVVRDLAPANEGRGGSWGPDGTIIFTPNLDGPIYRIAATGGDAVPVTPLDDAVAVSHRHPSFLPNGEHFLFFIEGPQQGIYIGGLDGSPTTFVTDADGSAVYSRASGHLLFTRQGTLLAQGFDLAEFRLSGSEYRITNDVEANSIFQTPLSISDDGTIAYRSGLTNLRQMKIRNRQGQELRQIGRPQNFITPSVSHDGTTVAVSLVRENLDRSIWTLDLGPLGTESPLNRDTSLSEVGQQWSPSGDRIIFTAIGGGETGMYIGSLSSAEPPELFSSVEEFREITSTSITDVDAIDWSQDGDLLLRTRGGGTGWDLWLWKEDRSTDPVQVAGGPLHQRGGQFSPDGKWFAYQSNHSGQYEIYIRAIMDSDLDVGPVSDGGGAQPRWSNDGTELYYVALNDDLMSVPVRLFDNGRRPEYSAPTPFFTTQIGGAVQDPASQQYGVDADGNFLLAELAETGTPITIRIAWEPEDQ